MPDRDKLLNIVYNHEIQLPPRFLGSCFLLLHKYLIRNTDYRFVYHFRKEEYRHKQFILIGDHASRGVYAYTITGSPNPYMNIVLGFHNLFSRRFFRFLLALEVIPKKLYEPDLHAMGQMSRVVKRGGCLCFFPEGIQSVSGSTMPMNPGTIAFLKRQGVDVILCKSYGAYLCSPRYRRDLAKGPMEFHYEVLFTGKELKEKREEELYAKYLERFSYNDFLWNKMAHHRYVFEGGSARGIEGILYHCPRCHKEFGIYGDGDDIICRACGNRIHLDEYYELRPYEGSICGFDSIDAWFKYQRRLVRQEIRDEAFAAIYEADLVTLHYDKLYDEQEYVIGCGTVTISREGIRYTGTKNGETVDILYELKHIPSFTFMPQKDNDFYYGGEYLLFRPKKDKARVVKYMMYVEELHNLGDPHWDKVSRDVYGQ